ncbi:hypothetical protein [uncultured Shewanella sp.]|uniref:hypothetical protein n=1 Tax=uncultured Shewanella sp. TaxID=173975 RepID=UPI00263036E8|nr:hypothetical protein [uncultured Shewanella sp.]
MAAMQYLLNQAGESVRKKSTEWRKTGKFKLKKIYEVNIEYEEANLVLGAGKGAIASQMSKAGLNVLSVFVSKIPNLVLFENHDVYQYEQEWRLHEVEYTDLGDGGRYYWSEVMTHSTMWTDVENVSLHETKQTGV